MFQQWSNSYRSSAYVGIYWISSIDLTTITLAIHSCRSQDPSYEAYGLPLPWIPPQVSSRSVYRAPCTHSCSTQRCPCLGPYQLMATNFFSIRQTALASPEHQQKGRKPMPNRALSVQISTTTTLSWGFVIAHWTEPMITPHGSTYLPRKCIQPSKRKTTS